MKRKIIYALLTLQTVLQSSIAFSQAGVPTIQVPTDKFDSLLTVAVRGLSAQKSFDTLQRYHKRVWNDYMDALSTNQRIFYDDSLVRALNQKLSDSLDAMRTRESKAFIERDIAKAQYVDLKQKNSKPFGFMFGVHAQPKPLLVTYGITLGWSPQWARFRIPLGPTAEPVHGSSTDINGKLQTGY